MSKIVDLSALPPPAIIEDISFDAILAERKAWFIAQYPPDQQDAVRRTVALESEPVTKLLRESSYRETILRQRINEAALAVMLPYARGDDLRVLAANLNTEIKIIQQADDTVTPPVPEITESDDELRARAQQAYEGLSVAGPTGAYEWHAAAADARVQDVKAISPEPCDIVVYVMARDGDGSAPEDLLQTVYRALSDKDTRPAGDRVSVQSVQPVPYAITALLYLSQGPEVELVLDAATVSLQQYITRQRRIGKSVRLSAIYAALHVEGVRRVALEDPLADILLTDGQVGHCTDFDIRYGGRDD